MTPQHSKATIDKRRADSRPIGVIGAGIAGLAAARLLHQQGWSVEVFDKGRGVGGRCATRRTPDGSQFDHGAQYITVRSAAFAACVESWRSAAAAAPWEARIVALADGQMTPTTSTLLRYVGVPGMSALAQQLAVGLQVHCGVHIAAIIPEKQRYLLRTMTENLLGPFDGVLVSAPAPQAAALLAAAPHLAESAATVSYTPCWAVLVAWDQPLEIPFEGAFVHGSPLAWMARDSDKPGRPSGDCWVLHATPAWSREHVDDKPDAVATLLCEALHAALPREVATPMSAPRLLRAHRWRFAQPTTTTPEPCLFDEDRCLAAAGDWCGGPRVEGAYLSGCAAAERFLAL